MNGHRLLEACLAVILDTRDESTFRVECLRVASDLVQGGFAVTPAATPIDDQIASLQDLGLADSPGSLETLGDIDRFLQVRVSPLGGPPIGLGPASGAVESPDDR